MTVRLLNATLWLVIVNVLEFTTVKFSAVRSDPRATVPAMVSAANCWPEPRRIDPLAPVNATEEPFEVKVVAEEAFQEPAMVTVANPKVRTAGPLEFRSPLKTAVELVSVRAPDQVRLEAKVVMIPGFTSRLYRVWLASIEPPETFTTIVEVPAANAPADVLNDRTVMMLALATSAPPNPTIIALAVIGRPEAEVATAVVPGPPWMVIAFATSPFEAIMNVVVEEPLSNSIVLNSLPAKLAPAKVMTWSEVASNVTMADPADLDAEVDAFVQFPE